MMMLSSCSSLNNWFNLGSTHAYIKIDYKNDKVTVNNTTGHDYFLKLVSNEKAVNGSDEMNTSDYIDIKQGEHSYNLDLRNVVPDDMSYYSDFDTARMKANSIYIGYCNNS